MHMIAVGDISLIGYSRDNSESLLKALSELICGTLNRRAVNAECNIGVLRPYLTLLIHVFHNRKCKRCRLR